MLFFKVVCCYILILDDVLKMHELLLFAFVFCYLVSTYYVSKRHIFCSYMKSRYFVMLCVLYLYLVLYLSDWKDWHVMYRFEKLKSTMCSVALLNQHVVPLIEIDKADFCENKF